jgi:F-type H+-transporting ATPase subunit delta
VGNTTPKFISNILTCHTVSGGFANVHPGNKLTINVVEAAPLEAFSLEVCNQWFLDLHLTHVLLPQATRANLSEALKITAGNGSEEDKIKARIEADVYEALQHALGSK